MCILVLCMYDVSVLVCVCGGLKSAFLGTICLCTIFAQSQCMYVRCVCFKGNVCLCPIYVAQWCDVALSVPAQFALCDTVTEPCKMYWPL